MSQPALLIVKKTAEGSDDLQDLLKILTAKFKMDAYSGRQRLIGQGISCFAQAPREKLEKIAGLLERYGVEHWVFEPTPPRFAPARVRSLSIGENALVFYAGENKVVLEKGARVLAILADLTGAVIERNIKRLLVQNAYRGSAAASQLEDDDIYKTVLQSKPPLDLYLLDPKGAIQSAVRIFAGRFDPQGLGPRKTYSVAGNIDALIRLVGEYAGDFTLRTDFGLSDLPGCKLFKLEPDQVPDKRHLSPLTRFGWMMADLLRQEQPEKTPEGLSPELVAAGAVLGAPVAAAVAAATGTVIPGMEELAAEIGAEPQPRREEPPLRGKELPPPPDLPPESSAHTLRKMAPYAIVAAALALINSGSGGAVFDTVVRLGFRTGIAPALLSGGALWGGFHYLRLKRQVENLPTSKARSVAMGLVEVQGMTRRKYALVSPMTHQPCVYYRVNKYRRSDESRQWELSGSMHSGPVPFDLEDDTGRLTINPRGATIKARHKQEGVPGQMTLLMAASNVSDSSEKWVEEIIPEGVFLYVLGFARAPRIERASLRERTVAALRELKQNRHKLQRYDTDGDGQISEEEWQAAREEVEQQVLHQSLAERLEAAPQQAQVEIGRPERRSLPFVIAETESETHLTRKLTLAAIPLLAIGFGLGIFALVKLVRFFGAIG